MISDVLSDAVAAINAAGNRGSSSTVKQPDLVLDEKYIRTAADREYEASAAWQGALNLIKAYAKVFFDRERQLAE